MQEQSFHRNYCQAYSLQLLHIFPILTSGKLIHVLIGEFSDSFKVFNSCGHSAKRAGDNSCSRWSQSDFQDTITISAFKEAYGYFAQPTHFIIVFNPSAWFSAYNPSDLGIGFKHKVKQRHSTGLIWDRLSVIGAYQGKEQYQRKEDANNTKYMPYGGICKEIIPSYAACDNGQTYTHKRHLHKDFACKRLQDFLCDPFHQGRALFLGATSPQKGGD